MKRKIPLRIAAVAAFAVASVLLAACSSGTPGGTGGKTAAATWKPTKLVTIYTGYDPGGSGDQVSRELAELMQKDWGVTVNVQNQSGGNGTVAITSVLDAPADGYTVGVAPGNQLVTGPLTTPGLSYSGVDDWTSLNGILDQQTGLLVQPSSGWKDVKDFIKAAKAKPGQLTVGVPTATGANAIAVESLSQLAGIKVKIVPFTGGSGESVTALLGGQIDGIWATISGQVGLLQAGKLVSLGHSGSKPYTAAHSETLKSQGYDITNLASPTYYVYGPKGMPAKVVAGINAEFQKLYASDAFKKWLSDNSYLAHETDSKQTKAELVQATKDEADGLKLLKEAGLIQ